MLIYSVLCVCVCVCVVLNHQRSFFVLLCLSQAMQDVYGADSNEIRTALRMIQDTIKQVLYCLLVS